jgi:glycerophosphoryl diester phosphodiesterase
MTASQEPRRRVAVSAHQGGSELVRPSSYEAYEQAAATGAEYVEFDIRRTRDRVLVVCHDGQAGRPGRPVPELTYGQLCEASGYPVPRVGEVMRLLAGQVTGHLDLKETGYEAEVIELALATFGPGRFVATTLEDASIAAIKRAYPEVRTALSLGRGLGDVPPWRWPALRASELFPLDRIRRCGADWVAVNHQIARLGILGTCQRHGIGVMVWTVDSDRLISSYLADPRVDVLITNRPRRAVQLRAGLGGPGRPGAVSPG